MQQRPTEWHNQVRKAKPSQIHINKIYYFMQFLPFLKKSSQPTSFRYSDVLAFRWLGWTDAKRSNAEVSNEKVAELLNLRDDAPDKII